jgi:hypothetical protein
MPSVPSTGSPAFPAEPDPFNSILIPEMHVCSWLLVVPGLGLKPFLEEQWRS